MGVFLKISKKIFAWAPCFLLPVSLYHFLAPLGSLERGVSRDQVVCLIRRLVVARHAPATACRSTRSCPD